MFSRYVSQLLWLVLRVVSFVSGLSRVQAPNMEAAMEVDPMLLVLYLSRWPTILNTTEVGKELLSHSTRFILRNGQLIHIGICPPIKCSRWAYLDVRTILHFNLKQTFLFQLRNWMVRFYLI